MIKSDTITASSKSACKRGYRLLKTHALLGCASSLLLLVGCIAGALLWARSRQKLRRGLVRAMNQYSHNVKFKLALDRLQIELFCCGIDSYADWFFVPAILPDNTQGSLVDSSTSLPVLQRLKELPLPANLPYSCCSSGECNVGADQLGHLQKDKSLKQRVARQDYYYGNNDDDKDESDEEKVEHQVTQSPLDFTENNSGKLKTEGMYLEGCHPKLLQRSDDTVRQVFAVLACLALYQLVVALMSRLLQTAKVSAFSRTQGNDCFDVWLFGGAPTNSERLPHHRSKRLRSSKRQTKKPPHNSSDDDSEGAEALLSSPEENHPIELKKCLPVEQTKQSARSNGSKDKRRRIVQSFQILKSGGKYEKMPSSPMPRSSSSCSSSPSNPKEPTSNFPNIGADSREIDDRDRYGRFRGSFQVRIWKKWTYCDSVL
ncbi:hypothetical protein QAD02_005593 [Eretmocerus hayati]|uniref:Uncharacterized protein n=1 Tax=Eretmocerus hayati TaxID=131215 RepID=A0ACC2NT57_9HYME|nr:hypothetical protein QAD02_005593 [Eretmocerus hayati]